LDCAFDTAAAIGPVCRRIGVPGAVADNLTVARIPFRTVTDLILETWTKPFLGVWCGSAAWGLIRLLLNALLLNALLLNATLLVGATLLLGATLALVASALTALALVLAAALLLVRSPGAALLLVLSLGAAALLGLGIFRQEG
jgi:hypothetical protein